MIKRLMFLLLFSFFICASSGNVWPAAGDPVLEEKTATGDITTTGNVEGATLTESANAVPNSTDHLGFFALTTSAQLLGVLSDETGSGNIVAGTGPTITDPVITNISPDANFTITQNSVTPFVSENASAAGNTLYLKQGNVGIGTSSPGNALDVLSSTSYLTQRLTQTKTDSTLQRAGIVVQHYTAAEEPLGLIMARIDATTSVIGIGGYTSSANAATAINFYTGATSTTTGGTIAMSIDSNGLIARKVTAGITAVNPGGQGDGALVANINEVSTVGTADDAVTLPSAAAGLEIRIINNGVNQLEIWPASGDNAGAGANNAVTLAAGSNVTYVAYDSTNWEQF